MIASSGVTSSSKMARPSSVGQSCLIGASLVRRIGSTEQYGSGQAILSRPRRLPSEQVGDLPSWMNQVFLRGDPASVPGNLCGESAATELRPERECQPRLHADTHSVGKGLEKRR